MARRSLCSREAIAQRGTIRRAEGEFLVLGRHLEVDLAGHGFFEVRHRLFADLQQVLVSFLPDLELAAVELLDQPGDDRGVDGGRGLEVALEERHGLFG